MLAGSVARPLGPMPSANAERASKPAKRGTAVTKRVRDDDLAFPSRRDRPHGRLARPHRPDNQLGYHGRRGDVVLVAFDGERPSWRADLRHAADPAAALDRGAALPLLRRLSRQGAPARALLFRPAVLAGPGTVRQLAADPGREPEDAKIPDFA